MLEYFKENDYIFIFVLGLLFVLVLGCVDGWFELYGKFGKLGMNDILVLVIDYVENGFLVLEFIVWYMECFFYLF